MSGGSTVWYPLRVVAATIAMCVVVLFVAACGGGESANPSESTATLPASFPKSDVPLVDGTVIDAGERTQDGVTVFTVTKQAAEGGFDRAKRTLTDAGYQALGDGPDSGSRSAQFSGKGYVVTVSSVEGSAVPNAVFYSVSKG